MSQENGTTAKITFLPGNRVVTVEQGESLLKAARRAGIHINASCGGAGVCGKCRVIVEQGDLGGGRSEKLSQQDYQNGFRQACIAVIAGDAVIRIPAESGLGIGGLTSEVPARHRARQHVFELEPLKQEGMFMPPVEKFCLELPPPGAHDNMADAGRIVQALNNQYDERGLIIGLHVLRKIRSTIREGDFLVTVTLARAVHKKGRTHVVNVQPGCWTSRNYGLAIDIGTTTVYGQLVDHNSGRVLAEEGDYNGQIGYGEDVISRIIYAEKPEGLEKMQQLVSGTINGIISRLLKTSGVNRDEIISVTVAGNTTMSHLFLSLEPHNIRRTPYVPVSTLYPPIRAKDLNLDLAPQTVALLYPAISSYVGGDIVAGVMGSGMYRTEALTLYIDIGTNAEIVIGNKDWLVCAACSAGPAFEGGGITHGMRAAKGAIEDFGINPATFEPMNITIGNRPPIGICGSGLLAVVATLFECGVIDRGGKFRRGLATPRIRPGRSGYEYVLAWQAESGGETDIVLNEVDIDNFIRAKGAIFAGCKTLVEVVGLQISDLEQIVLAGAFGSFIDLDNAMTVGLLPEIDPARIMYVGNGSLLGARMSELSNHIRRDVGDVVRRMTSFELSEVTDFKDQYIASLFLPHTDLSLFPKIDRRLREREEELRG